MVLLTMRLLWSGIALLLLIAAPAAGAAESATVIAAEVHARDQWLHASVTFADLLDLRTASTIDSGLSGVCAYELSVLGPGGAAVGRRTWTLHLNHDLWEDRYVIAGPDSAVTVPGLAAMDSFCCRVEDVRLLPLGRLEPGLEYQLSVQVEVLPLASEDQDRLSRYISRRGGGTREELDLDLGSLFGRLFQGGRSGRTSLSHRGPSFRIGSLEVRP
jgi:hypothetical protein